MESVEHDPASPAETSPAASTQLDAVKGAFLAGLNHEVRTPLSGIVGMLDLLTETNLDGEQREYVGAARLCTESLLELLNAVLQFAALEGGQTSLDEGEFSVQEALNAAVNQQRSKADLKGLQLTVTQDPNVPVTLVGDAGRIRDLLSHLLSNAIKFTHAGSVELHAAYRNGGETQASLVFSVRDTGIGIPPDKLETIFESFRQGEDGLSRSFPGLGLGLALVRKLTDAMGGKIFVASQQGIGSVFTVEIPVARPPVAVAVESAPEPVPTILAVEDNPVGLKVLRHVLERRRVRVIPAASGPEAIEAARKQPVDLILMDLGMPEMDGLTAADEIRKLPGYESVPILALTANYSEHVKRECLDRGMKAFLSKPIDAQELWSTLSHYLRQQAG